MAEWYYRFEEDVEGPLSEDDFKHIFDSGALPLTTQVWREGMENWAEAKAIAILTIAPMPEVLAKQQVQPPQVLQPKPQSKGTTFAPKWAFGGVAVVCMVCLIVAGVWTMRQIISTSKDVVSLDSKQSQRDNTTASGLRHPSQPKEASPFTLTAQDRSDIRNGRIPSSIRIAAKMADIDHKTLTSIINEERSKVKQQGDPSGLLLNDGQLFWSIISDSLIHTATSVQMAKAHNNGAQDFGNSINSDMNSKAQQGDADAQYYLASSYLHGGEGVLKDTGKGIEWLRKAAEQGHDRGQVALATLYWEGEVVVKDFHEAVKWYRKAADKGNAAAQFGLGHCYAEGEGVAKDKEEAVRWYNKSAEDGNADAQLALGSCYILGEGVNKDKAEGMTWIRKAAAQGNADAANMLKRLAESVTRNESQKADGNDAVKIIREKAEEGYPQAQYDLGVLYFKGECVTEDKTEAVKWLRKAAEQGYAGAQYNLGYCYGTGEGVKRDDTEAIKWIRKAAAQGNPKATLFMQTLGR
jgi:TPR repeat protein